MSQINANAILDASGGTTASINGHTPTASNMAGKNRIINGDMRIDQRNNGASVTVTSGANATVFCVDRWQGRQENSSGAFTLQRSTDAPSGFVNSLVATVTTADASITSNEGYSVQQVVEGFNFADLGWGAAAAQSVTISFWVRSSVTGSFSLALMNSAYNRNYGALYTINSANTWEYKTVVVPGDTSGTWLTDNGAGIRVGFGLGAGTDRIASVGWSTPAVSNTKAKVTGGVDWIATNGATFYITGVQLEAGSVATPFEHRQYGQELALCQRYYQQLGGSAYTGIGNGINNAATTTVACTINYVVPMRAGPTSAIVGSLIATNRIDYDKDITGILESVAGLQTASLQFNHASGGTTFYAEQVAVKSGSTGYLTLSAEL